MVFKRRMISGASALAMVVVPALAQAQRGGAPAAPPAPGRNSVSPLIDMRRELDLTPRQLAALDSLERALDQRNAAVLEQLRVRRDSLAPGRGGARALTDEQRTALRARRDSLAPLVQQIRKNDSTARAAALRLLTEAQRNRVTEMQAERRGFAMGRMSARMGAGMRGGFGPVRRGAGLGGPGMRGRLGARGMGGRLGAPGMRGRLGAPGMGGRFGAPGMPGRALRGFRGPAGMGMRGGMAAPGLRRQMMPLPLQRRRMMRPDTGGMMDDRMPRMQAPPGAMGPMRGMRGRMQAPTDSMGPMPGMRGRMRPPGDSTAPRMRMRMMPPDDSTAPPAPPRPRRPPAGESARPAPDRTSA